jgi:hypothetical protein
MGINNRFTRGLIIGGIIGASVSMMNNGSVHRMRRQVMRMGRNMFGRRNPLVRAIDNLF